MIQYGPTNTKQVLNIAGSSTFGRYPKISIEKTYNMFKSDEFLVPYAGYKIALGASVFNDGMVGRGLFASIKFNSLVAVIDDHVYLIFLVYNQQNDDISFSDVSLIGTLATNSGVVYIAENNKPQIAISDGVHIYIYDPSVTPVFQIATMNNMGAPITFTPGYITFHDTYFLCAATNDTANSQGPFNNTWRLSQQNEGRYWPDEASFIGRLQTKPDNTRAVVRFPSKGNMIFVMGGIVTEAWFDTGAQLFPYQRNNQFNIDYGCLSPATVAYMDEIVVWLAQNEKSGPIIMYSDGGMPKKITTDGIDFLFSELQNPQDSQGFLYRQDGHLFYHINFYSDNLSLFYDFNADKFYHACDQSLNYFIAAEIAFFGNQYYFVSKNTGNLYAFDTSFYTYEDSLPNGVVVSNEIPRFRICRNMRDPDQNPTVISEIGFTIETGETNYFVQNDGSQTTPSVDLSISYDGGASFGNNVTYELNPIGLRKNMLRWWQCGYTNDAVAQFKFNGIGRFVCTDGYANLRG